MQFKCAMKNKSFIVVSLLALISALAVPSIRAEEGSQEKPVSKSALKRYDKDKDGKLSVEEEAAMKAAKEKAKAARKAKKEAKETDKTDK